MEREKKKTYELDRGCREGRSGVTVNTAGLCCDFLDIIKNVFL